MPSRAVTETPREVGDKRTMLGRDQTMVGRCVHCGGWVWFYDEEIGETPQHSFCADKFRRSE